MNEFKNILKQIGKGLAFISGVYLIIKIIKIYMRTEIEAEIDYKKKARSENNKMDALLANRLEGHRNKIKEMNGEEIADSTDSSLDELAKLNNSSRKN